MSLDNFLSIKSYWNIDFSKLLYVIIQRIITFV